MAESIKTINIGDKEYPESLREIPNPPKALYYRGSLPRAEARGFGIVGTRRYSIYGKQVAFEIAGDLAEAGLTIVSGLAPGIDTFAHQATLERKGKTIAVLGTGVDEGSIYPKSNLKLSREIVENGGCLISEYPPGTRGAQFTFPQRNRIISGLSVGILVVEAKPPPPNFWRGGKEKSGSGSLITARHAFEQGRKVFAIPGPIYSSNSRGCHTLIKRGAILVENGNDILTELNLTGIKIIEPGEITGSTEEECLILRALTEGSLYIDKVIEKTKLDASAVSSALAILEIKGKIKSLGGNVYALSR